MDHRKVKASVAEFCRSREKVFVIPFDGIREKLERLIANVLKVYDNASFHAGPDKQ